MRSSNSRPATIPNPFDGFSSKAPGACVKCGLALVLVGTRCAKVCRLPKFGVHICAGQGPGANKDAKLPRKASSAAKGDLFDIQMLLTDRSGERSASLKCFRINVGVFRFMRRLEPRLEGRAPLKPLSLLQLRIPYLRTAFLARQSGKYHFFTK